MPKSWIGQKVTLKCFSDGFPTPTLTWIKQNGNDIKRIIGKENTVTVVMATDQDFGLYTCKTANGIRAASNRTVKLQQISKSVTCLMH